MMYTGRFEREVLKKERDHLYQKWLAGELNQAEARRLDDLSRKVGDPENNESASLTPPE